MLSFSHITKQFGKFTAVDDLSFSTERGEIFGFLGPNGAGKSTAMKMCMGILIPSSGEIQIFGQSIQEERSQINQKIGYLPENPMFYDYLKGREILQFVAEMNGFTRREAQRAALTMLEKFSLQNASEEFAVNYSLGMKKKLGLAQALISDPQLLILDEPTNGLDPRASKEVLDILIDFKNLGNTVFLSTHLMDLAEKMCDRIGIIHHGKIIADGKIDEIRNSKSIEGDLENLFLTLTN